MRPAHVFRRRSLSPTSGDPAAGRSEQYLTAKAISIARRRRRFSLGGVLMPREHHERYWRAPPRSELNALAPKPSAPPVHHGKAEDQFLRLGVIVKVPFGEGSIDKTLAAIRAAGVKIIYHQAARVPLFVTDVKPR